MPSTFQLAERPEEGECVNTLPPQSPSQPIRFQLECFLPQPDLPSLRANPFPEVTDPLCRLPLPTLFYRPEAFHLGDLMR